jgi:hypothetical protein
LFWRQFAAHAPEILYVLGREAFGRKPADELQSEKARNKSSALHCGEEL